MFKDHYEAAEVEVARLAEAPEGSLNHTLSTMPVNIRCVLADLVIELPPVTMHGHAVVVVPIERYVAPTDRSQMPWKRHRGSWTCVVIESTHQSYPVGGNRLSVPEGQLVRGRIRALAD